LVCRAHRLSCPGMTCNEAAFLNNSAGYLSAPSPFVPRPRRSLALAGVPSASSSARGDGTGAHPRLRSPPLLRRGPSRSLGLIGTCHRNPYDGHHEHDAQLMCDEEKPRARPGMRSVRDRPGEKDPGLRPTRRSRRLRRTTVEQPPRGRLSKRDGKPGYKGRWLDANYERACLWCVKTVYRTRSQL
jgi:hypothetical protein